MGSPNCLKGFGRLKPIYIFIRGARAPPGMRLPCLKHDGQINVHKQPKKRPEIHRKSKSVVTPGVGIRRLLRRRPGCPWVHGSKGTWVQGHMGPRAHGSKGPWPMMAQMGPRGSYGRVQGPPRGSHGDPMGSKPRDPWASLWDPIVPPRDPWVPPQGSLG